MKLRIHFKTPDALDAALQEAFGNQGLDSDDAGTVVMARNLAKRWVQFGENVRLELDTDTERIRVLPVSDL